ncbi:hypothetical protein CLV63_113199 [Murinocardiopsis flavida]|uniref:FtsK domain-containing protein n=1 Tax=Murinocardiopsis flavida TaxID=645275 RepID=A0A2P8DFQ7_9ACTN|nr:hypothetical protein [Murinocardiopsis flavida]PSK96036.1 hypothetical protein CLV63_113199 [Murinocardiopsis flavida]
MASRKKTRTLSRAEKAQVAAAARDITRELETIRQSADEATGPDSGTSTLRFTSEGMLARAVAALKAGPDSLRAHMRPQFYPWRVGIAVLAATYVQEVVTTLSVTSALTVAAGSAATAWAALALLRTAKARASKRADLAAAWVRDEPGHARVIAWAAVVWAVALHLLQPETAAEFARPSILFLLGFLAASARFWQVHRPERTAPAARSMPAGPPPPGEHPIARKWRTLVASGGGPLNSSKLSSVVAEEFGIQAVLELVPGKQDIDGARAALPKIATALGISAANLMIEPVAPTKDEPNPDPAKCEFRAVTASAIADGVALEGRRYERDGADGLVRIGPYADGDGEARLRLYTKDSMWGGYIVGVTGSGKSGMLDNLALAAWQSAHTVVFYIDGAKDGGSSPLIFERADWALGNQPDQWQHMADALLTLIRVRGAENRRRLKTSGFTPTPARPGVVVILDESHKIVTRNTAAKWGYITREGRASGVSVFMASQIFGLESFGGDDAVRSSVCAGNTVALQVGRNQAGMMDFPLNPAKLPKVAGIGLIDDGREAVFRAAHADGEDMAARMDAALVNAAALDPLAVGALDAGCDSAYSRRHEIAEQADAEVDAMLEALEAGISPTARTPRTSTGADAPAADSIAPPVIDPSVLSHVPDLSILKNAPAAPKWSGVHAEILDYLAEGPEQRKEIEAHAIQATGTARATVSRAIEVLRTHEEIAPVPGRRGLWQRTA